MGTQFEEEVPAFASFRRLRRNRIRFEYPGSPSIGASVDDVQDAIATASPALTQTRVQPDSRSLDRWV
jgi:hypothetical protein